MSPVEADSTIDTAAAVMVAEAAVAGAITVAMEAMVATAATEIIMAAVEVVEAVVVAAVVAVAADITGIGTTVPKKTQTPILKSLSADFTATPPPKSFKNTSNNSAQSNTARYS